MKKIISKIRNWFKKPVREKRKHYAQCRHQSWAFVHTQPISERLIYKINEDINNPLNHMVSSYLIDRMLGITPDGVEITPQGYELGKKILHLEIQKYLN